MGFDLSPISQSLENVNFSKKLVGTWIPENYDEIVDESILNVSFIPDTFQKQSFYFLQKNESIFVSAHTSSGKTLVAEYAIHLAQKNGNRVIYTSPIKALSNQKFYDFKSKFQNVGLITGDVQVNPEADCLIMTTEILRNMVYKNSDLLRNTEFVIFDEVHYINDLDRGVVWEEAIIMLPKHISLVMLSATIPNSMEFSEWVGRTKNRCIYVISTDKRAVPLEFAIYSDFSAYSIFDLKKDGLTNFKEGLIPYSKKTKAGGRFRINDLGHFVTNRKLTPAIFFSFSKRSCEEYGKSLQNLDLTNSMEKKQISQFLDEAVGCLNEGDRYLPQVCRMREQALKGVAVHHGSLLPFVKECVEILFSQNLIKILVATETFAMGVNMPAKCCAFLSLTKIDNGNFRFIQTGEFIQMSGRAGRRGMDKVGTVLIADQRNPPLTTVKKVICGIQKNLHSQFKLSFSMILMALRGNVAVEELMRNSFKEHNSQKGFTSDMARLAILESEHPLKCDSCKDAPEFLRIFRKLILENQNFVKIYLKVGDVVVTKFNTIQKIVEISGNRIKCTRNDEKVDFGCFFGKSKVGVESKDIKSPFPTSSPTFIKQNIEKDIILSDILFFIKNEKISFDYNFNYPNEILKIRELESLWLKLNCFECILSPCFEQHYFLRIDQILIEDEINFIKNKYSEFSLIQMEEYTARISFLLSKGFVEKNSFLSITLKGRVAAEIRTVNEVFVTELCFLNYFYQLSPEKILAFLSSMINEEEIDEQTSELHDCFDEMKNIFDEMQNELDSLGVPRFQELNFGMSQAVFDWASGLSLGRIVAKHDIAEGAFVRLILRLEECCREMINATGLIGNKDMENKFVDAIEKIKRDIIFMPSLYI